MENGFYKIKDVDGNFADAMAIQIKDGTGRAVRLTADASWTFVREAFTEMSAAQIDALTANGLHDNQTAAWHTA